MMFKFVTVGLAYTAAFAAAFTAPKLVGDPSGNAITSPGLNEEVPAGKPFTIVWEPSTDGPVTLYFLKGPSTNAVPQYAIAEHIANSGSYSWTPSTSLAPGTSGYGILLVDDVTGEYQYSTQFGIKNANYGGSSDATTSKAAAGATTTASAVTKTTAASSDLTAVVPATYTTASANDDDESDDDESDDDEDTTALPSYAAATTTSSLTKPTLAPTTAVITVKPSASGNSTAPTLRTTTSPAPTAQSTGPVAATGAAAHTVAASFAGLVFAAGVAVLAL
jgi:hypothetical protein